MVLLSQQNQLKPLNLFDVEI